MKSGIDSLTAGTMKASGTTVRFEITKNTAAAINGYDNIELRGTIPAAFTADKLSFFDDKIVVTPTADAEIKANASVLCSNYSATVKKYDSEETSRLLGGAEFMLSRARCDIAGKTIGSFESIGTYTTVAGEELRISSGLYPGFIYCLTENHAPDGYRIESKPKYFAFYYRSDVFSSGSSRKVSELNAVLEEIYQKQSGVTDNLFGSKDGSGSTVGTLYFPNRKEPEPKKEEPGGNGGGNGSNDGGNDGDNGGNGGRLSQKSSLFNNSDIRVGNHKGELLPATGDTTHTARHKTVFISGIIILLLLFCVELWRKDSPRKKRYGRLKRSLRIAEGITLAAALIAGTAWVYDLYRFNRQDAAFEEVRDVRDFVIEISRETGTVENPQLPDPGFHALKKLNDDYLGWLSIDKTQIDYPVCMTPDDPEYYLSRDFNGNDSPYGTPFADPRCNQSETGLIVYGHHMKNGSMFADLTKYSSRDFALSHPLIHLKDENKDHQYEVAAVIRYNALHDGSEWIPLMTSRNSDEFRKCWEYVSQESCFTPLVNPEPDSHILALVTCDYTIPHGRLIVFAVEN